MLSRSACGILCALQTRISVTLKIGIVCGLWVDPYNQPQFGGRDLLSGLTALRASTDASVRVGWDALRTARTAIASFEAARVRSYSSLDFRGRSGMKVIAMPNRQ